MPHTRRRHRCRLWTVNDQRAVGTGALMPMRERFSAMMELPSVPMLSVHFAFVPPCLRLWRWWSGGDCLCGTRRLSCILRDETVICSMRLRRFPPGL